MAHINTAAVAAARAICGDAIVALRRELHAHPCLSGQEQDTVARVAAFLRPLGLPLQPVANSTGLIVQLPHKPPQPGRGVPPPRAVVVRADLDALPVTENTGLPFASTRPGVHHACGHDGHTAMLAGAAAVLCRDAAPLQAPVRFIFQPAEETGHGALAMMAAGALENAGLIFGGHLDRAYPTGTLVVAPGCVNASTDTVQITVEGKSGHGARPHEAVDAIVAAAAIVSSLQTVVARRIGPAEPAVVTVGSFHAGSAPNIIAGRAELQGTVRALSAEVRQQLQQRIEEVASGVAAAHGATATVRFVDGTPPVVNDARTVAIARGAAAAVVGAEQVKPALHQLNMGGEDFGFYVQDVPGCYIRLGTCPPGATNISAHTAEWDMDEDTLCIGAAYYAEVARRAAQQLAAEARGGGAE